MANTKLADRQKSDSIDLTSEVVNSLPASNGGTGNATNVLNAIMLGNGTGALQTLVGTANGQVATWNGTTWISTAPAAGGGTAAYYPRFLTAGA